MILLKSSEEIAIMRKGGAFLAGIMEELKRKVLPGITTEEFNRLAESLIFKLGKPSFKGYQGFPATLCVSLNEEVVHGLPSKRRIKDGDILSFDLGLNYKGFHTDMAITVPVGNVDPEALKIVKVAEDALDKGISAAKRGGNFGDIGEAVQNYVESHGFTIIRNLCGHGIGRSVHEDPQVLNFGRRGEGAKIEVGAVFCIEPIIGGGTWEIEKAGDGFAYKTKDNSLSAHFEHTVAVTEKGIEILTMAG